MEQTLKKRVREHYMNKHRAGPGVGFDDCFPGGRSRKLSRIGHILTFGMAASMLIVVGASLFFQGVAGGGSVPVASGNLVTGLQRVMEANAILALNRDQRDYLKQELDGFAWPIGDEQSGDSSSARLALLETLLESRSLNLDTRQAMALTGLLSGWEDDMALAHYVADCSTHCHQADLSGDTGQARLRDYLVDCLNTSLAKPCTGAGPYGGIERQGAKKTQLLRRTGASI